MEVWGRKGKRQKTLGIIIGEGKEVLLLLLLLLLVMALVGVMMLMLMQRLLLRGRKRGKILMVVGRRIRKEIETIVVVHGEVIRRRRRRRRSLDFNTKKSIPPLSQNIRNSKSFGQLFRRRKGNRITFIICILQNKRFNRTQTILGLNFCF